MSLSAFPAVVTLPVLWGDQDLFGHVNNTIYIRWFESARVAYWDSTGMRDLLLPLSCGPILAAVHCNYRKQLKYPDTIQVGASVRQLGRTSLKIEHQVYSEQRKEVVADGESIVVVFNYAKQQSEVVSDELRRLIEQVERPFQMGKAE
jgi:acyl-CoA thioester hydrolase